MRRLVITEGQSTATLSAGDAGEAPENLNRVLWRALVEAFALFLNQAQQRVEIKHGEKHPRCGHAF